MLPNNPPPPSYTQDDAPWLWFDVDDVLVESTPLFQESLDRWSGTVVPWQTWTHNQFHKFYGVKDDDDETFALLRKQWKDDRILERSPLFEGVSETLQKLSDQGFKLGLLTARAWHPDGVAITQTMADDHHLPVSQIISMDYSGTKAEFLKKTGTRVEGFIDDTIRHVEGGVSAGFNAVLMHQPWNVQATHLARVKCMTDYPAWIAKAMAAKQVAAARIDEGEFPVRRPRRPG